SQLHVVSPFAKHRPPLWCGWRNAQAEETQTGCGEDCGAKPDGCQHQNWAQGVWEQMAKQDATTIRTCSSCGQHIVLFSQHQECSPDHSRKRWERENTDGKNDIDFTVTKNRD